MGAVGVHRTMDRFRDCGFEPIELERYCGSNKIWTTKVKRLRLPDLLCVKTGMRAEVRAKTDLKIRMSDAPANPDRVWDAGLRDDDIVAVITCFDRDGGPEPADDAVYFTVGALRASADRSKLGPPKSASEGAERNRTWPATVPTRVAHRRRPKPSVSLVPTRHCRLSSRSPMPDSPFRAGLLPHSAACRRSGYGRPSKTLRCSIRLLPCCSLPRVHTGLLPKPSAPILPFS